VSFRVGAFLLFLALIAESSQVLSSARSKFDADVWVRTKVDALVQAARAAYEDDKALPAYRTRLKSITRTIRRRKLADDQDFVARYREFVEYIQVAALDQRPDHELGFNVPDRQYFEETRNYVEIPEFLLGQRFLRSVSRYETLDRAKSFLRQLNQSRSPSDQLIFFSYASRHLGTPDNDDSYRRLLIVVPGDLNAGIPERWVQFGVTDPKMRRRVRNVSVVSAVARPGGTFNTYFKDYFRTFRSDGSITIKGRWELGYGDDNCVRCHKSGILPIFPEKYSVSPSEQQAVEAVNQRFRSYGSPRFDKYLDQTKLGPGLSSAGLSSRSQRFGEGFNETAVGRAMSCVDCHRLQGLGALNWPMDRVVISSYIEGGQMPRGFSLRDAERSELHAKLIDEYFATDDANPGILKAWLLGRLR
jgi:hypothetical protein